MNLKFWLLRLCYDELIFKGGLNRINISCFSYMGLVGMKKIWFRWKFLWRVLQLRSKNSFVFELFLMFVPFGESELQNSFVCEAQHSNGAVPVDSGGWTPALIDLLFIVFALAVSGIPAQSGLQSLQLWLFFEC